MMNKHKIAGLAVAVSTLMVACQKDKLEPIPQTQISDAVAFQTPARALQQVNGLYSALKAGQFYAGRYMVYQDVRGEEFINVTNNGVTAFLTWNFTVVPTSNEVQGFWAAAYAAINRANVVIEGLENSPIEAGIRNAYIGEAKVVRALSYFALLQLYARPFTANNGNSPGVPLRLTAIKGGGFNNLERATVAAVYNQILQDLNEAEAALPASYANAVLNTTRAHKNTAIALKTRVLLNMGRYADVITEGNKIVPNAAPWVSGSNYDNQLAANIATVFQPPYTNKESILSMPFTALDLPGTQNSLGSYYNPGPNGLGDFELNTTGNGIVANTGWRTQDARRAFNIADGGGRLRLRKWPNNPGATPDWAPVIRYSEVMLNVAEAAARQDAGISQRALALVNAVRKRSDAGADITAANRDALINAILTERRIELLGEGHRTSDIIRLGVPFPAKGTISAVPPSSPLYIWPISNAEIITNQLCAQNEGY